MMRPPMQKSALQQNEANRLQHHQQQPHKHLQQQKQLQQQQQQQQQQTLQQQSAIITTNISDLQQQQQQHTLETTTATRKSKLEQRELLVENHLNNACFAQVHHQQQQQQQKTKPTVIARKSLPAYYNDYYQQQQQHQQRPSSHLVNSHHNNTRNNIKDSATTVNILDDLKTSSVIPTPPPPTSLATAPTPPPTATVHESLLKTQTTATTELLQNHIPSTIAHTATTNSSTTTNNSQRFSFTSQYSSRSSSSDDSSLSLTTTTTATAAACANNKQHGPGGGIGGGFIVDSSSGSFNSYNNTFDDDGAENFIINFPADTSPLPQTTPVLSSSSSSSTTTPATLLTQSSDYCCLPLSETEPLLTNIEATVNDRQRSIYLNKNSASLIFTKKDLKAATTYQQQQQQQFRLQSKTNNNFNGSSATTNANEYSSSSSSIASSVNAAPARRHQHSTLRSFSEENYKRKPTKHLPATYHQQHRRSLQLNYNNNLVTTTACGTIANNNHHQHHCCSVSSGSGSSSGSLNSNSAVLHKPKTPLQNNHNYQHQQQQLQRQHHYQQQQQHCSLNSNPNTPANNTAAATRKQYAYSWYAPVYSALEEELEQDSRDSSPIHNLANTKKQNINQYHHTNDLNSTSLTITTDNETEALLESRNNINIQTHLQANPLKRESITKQLHPTKLALQHTRNSSSKGGNHQAVKSINLNGSGSGGAADIAAVEGYTNYELEGPHAGSLGLAGGPQPRRIRFGNFLKSLVGLRPSIPNRNGGEISVAAANETQEWEGGERRGGDNEGPLQIPSSPEITITRTPSEQNMVVMRDPAGYREYNAYGSREKLANTNNERIIQSGGSTSSLNVMQQKLWNIMRREGSAISLHQEKSQSIVHYTGLRKCETVLALTRQNTTPCSPTLGAGAVANKSRNRLSEGHARMSHTGSGIFSASGVEQIRPLNRLRNSISSMNNTCSRCSSLLSLAASSSRFSLNNAMAAHSSHQHLRNPSNISSSNISSTFSRSRDGSIEAGGGLQFAVKRNSRTSLALGCQRNSASGANSLTSSRTPSMTSPTTTTTTATTASTVKLTTPPTDNNPTVPIPNPASSYLIPPPTQQSLLAATTCKSPTTREGIYLPLETLTAAPLTVTSLLKVITKKDTMDIEHAADDDEYDVIDGVYNTHKNSSLKTTPTTSTSPFSATVTTTTLLPIALTNVTPSTSTNAQASNQTTGAAAVSATTSESIMATILQHCNTNAATNIITSATTTTTTTPTRPFEIFTCKLCLIDVEDSSNSTTLHQCGCLFCTECMRAYVEFEISEGAYEISCPDAQCPEQGVITLPEIANLTTNNLMKKHHRYRLNREIELDKTRTWCPRAGCETVCLIGSTSSQSDAAPSTSTSSSAASATIAVTTPSVLDATASSLCAVQCPSCKDEFCSSCKKTWHPNITCEEHSRRLAADGQDDIGIPFDNDLIKCCPMCAVPIEKDEGCAQMMCKRCKHVFCWYCLASLDDDFLLRHYDKGPCKNKLGHSRASVVWHRAQVIGIFAGFGILLLVASPLLLLAAPCIICCKCRSCSGSKIDEGDGEMDEATALQSLN